MNTPLGQINKPTPKPTSSTQLFSHQTNTDTPTIRPTPTPMSASAPNQPGPHKSSLFRGLQKPQSQPSAGGGNNGGNGKRIASKYNNEIEVEQENDSIINALTSDMTRLKQEARHLQQDVFAQNQLLDKLQDFMQSARDGVVGSVGKIDNVMGRYGFKHTVFFAVLACLALILIFYGTKYAWSNSGSTSTTIVADSPTTLLPPPPVALPSSPSTVVAKNA